MLEAAEENEADIVTGNVMRLRDGVLGTARLFEIVFSQYRYDTDIHKSPVLIHDSISCDKMIRRSFWQENNIVYPEGITFEDIPITFKAYCCARKVIMLDEIVYYWRVRDGATQSITQQKTLSIVRDRLNALGIVNRYCAENAVEDSLVSEWKYKNLTVDLNVLINKAVDFNDEQLEESISAIRQYIVENGLQSEFKRLPVLYKEKYKAILAGDLDRLRELRKFQLDPASSVRTIRAAGKVMGLFPRKVLWHRLADMTADLDAELLRQKATKVAAADGKLTIKGCAYMRYLPVRKPEDAAVTAWLADRERNKVHPVTLKKHTTSIPFSLEKKKNSNRVAYRGTGYTVELGQNDFHDLKPGQYKILIEWNTCGQYRETTISQLDREDLCKAASIWNNANEGVVLSFTEKREPVFTVYDTINQR
jgi:CDP-glycerol glycerophosphotransferase